MSPTAIALVLVAALLHSVWNVAAKKAGGDDRFALFSAGLLTVVWAPVGIWAAWGVIPGWGWRERGIVLASAVVHLAYFQTLLRGYRLSDLTVVYPVARGTGPLLSSFGALLLLGESLGLRAGLGWGAATGVTRHRCEPSGARSGSTRSSSPCSGCSPTCSCFAPSRWRRSAVWHRRARSRCFSRR